MNIALLVVSVVCIAIVITLSAAVNWRASALQESTLGRAGTKARRVTACAAALIIVSCLLPMGLSPAWNGEEPEHRNQYELITESFLAGKLHFLYDYVDHRLLEMENPYDTQERERLGVYYYWDHAFYDGQYYMYFGVVPVFLAFLPYRILTGQALTSYHATQLFTGVYIAGLFALLGFLGRKFFKEMPLSLYLLLCAAASYISVWCAVAAPALYCTAITCALACAVWSLYFFSKAVWGRQSENRAIAYAAFGALLGALEFGCRPTVGLSNILVLPLLVVFLKERRFSIKLAGKLICAALPYVIVAVGLMWYNAARFGNPFEFGQSYQMTITDQSTYGDMLSRLKPASLLWGLYYYFFNINRPDILPSIGLFITFPLLPAAIALLARREKRRAICEKGLLSFTVFLVLSVLLIITFELLWAPHPTPRYRMDFSWLLCILAFILIGCPCRDLQGGRNASKVFGALCVLALVISVLLALYPQSQNFTEYYGSEIKAMLGL